MFGSHEASLHRSVWFLFLAQNSKIYGWHRIHVFFVESLSPITWFAYHADTHNCNMGSVVFLMATFWYMLVAWLNQVHYLRFNQPLTGWIVNIKSLSLETTNSFLRTLSYPIRTADKTSVGVMWSIFKMNLSQIKCSHDRNISNPWTLTGRGGSGINYMDKVEASMMPRSIGNWSLPHGRLCYVHLRASVPPSGQISVSCYSEVQTCEQERLLGDISTTENKENVKMKRG